MSAADVLGRLGELLSEERAAIAALDGARVEAIAYEKLALVGQLEALSAAERSAIAPQLRALVAELRRNGVLLVHAKGILTEVLRLRGFTPPVPVTPFFRGHMQASPSPARVSVRG